MGEVRSLPIPKYLLQSNCTKMEIRKDINLFWRKLKVSNKWNIMIKSLKWDWLVLKQYNKQGYRRVNICKWGEIHQWMVHRLVAHTFLWLDLSMWKSLCALHKNDIRDDNRVENIYVWTYKDNAIDRSVRNRWFKCKWSNNPSSILKEDEVVEIKKLLKEWKKHWEIWTMFWVSRDAIQKISSWKNWRHIQIF